MNVYDFMIDIDLKILLKLSGSSLVSIFIQTDLRTSWSIHAGGMHLQNFFIIYNKTQN
jgi:hypothetical protein